MQAVNVGQAGQRVSPEGRDRVAGGCGGCAARSPHARLRAGPASFGSRAAVPARNPHRRRYRHRRRPGDRDFRSVRPHRRACRSGPLSLSGTKITMENPRLTGYRERDLRPYEVTAIAAMQDMRKPTSSSSSTCGPARDGRQRRPRRGSNRPPACSTPRRNSSTSETGYPGHDRQGPRSPADVGLHRLQGRHRGLARARDRQADQRLVEADPLDDERQRQGDRIRGPRSNRA